jgi:RNA polymerase sigma-70 factor (ECF subfamily)
MDDKTPRYNQFHEVFHKYYASLCSYAHSLIDDLDTAEDIVQDCFVKIWDKKKELVGSDNIRFYLFTAVRNNSLTHLSNQKKKGFAALPEDYRLADLHQVETEEKEEEKDYRALIQDALQLLPPKCREVFILCRISSLSYQEVAKTLGISVKTVENQMGKAIRIVRKFAKENKLYFVLLGLFFVGG